MMGFIGKLLGIGVAAGAAVAAVKVAQKYEENKNTQAAQAAAQEADDTYGELYEDDVAYESETPDEEAVPQPGVFDDVKKAATDVYTETAGKVKNSVRTAAEKAGINTDEMTEALASAGKAFANAGKAVADKVHEEAPAAMEKAKVNAEKIATQVKETVSDIAEALRDKADDVVIDITDAVDAVTEPEEVDGVEPFDDAASVATEDDTAGANPS